MAWQIDFTRPAEKDLAKVSTRDLRYVINALERLAIDPYQSDIRKLAGRNNEWRLRVGDWRVRFILDSDTNTINILRILPRGRAYRD